MSLPSRALYFKENQPEPVHSSFINCGWSVSVESLIREILESPPCPTEFDYVVMYGLEIPKKFIQFKLNFSSYSKFEEAFKEFMKDKSF